MRRLFVRVGKLDQVAVVVGSAEMALAPVIHQRIARAAVEAEGRAVGQERRQVADAAGTTMVGT